MKNPINQIRSQRDNFEQINRDYLEEKNNTEGRTQLKDEVIRDKINELTEQTAGKIRDQRAALDTLWEETKAKTLIENKDPEDAVKALHAQNLAGERLPSSGDPGEIVSVVEEELNDRANTENYTRELWDLAVKKLQGQGKWDVKKDKMEDLRENYLLSDGDKKKLRIREALKETEGRKTNLKTMGNSIFKKIEAGSIETEEELENQFGNYIAPLMEKIEAAFQGI